MRGIERSFVLIALILVLTACAGDSKWPWSLGPTLDRITLSPIAPKVLVGDSLRMDALGTYSDGSVRDLTGTATWGSSDARIAALGTAAPGTVVGVGKGETTVTAALGKVAASMSVTVRSTSAPAPALLTPSHANSRYFEDSSGNIVYLAGAHTWLDLQDVGSGLPPPPFDFDEFLSFLVRHNLNFFRMWAWEQSRWMPNLDMDDLRIAPMPYQRTGPGTALDGLPKFDLTRFDETYFDRLRSRTRAAEERGIYVAIMLFNGWSVSRDKGGHDASNAWHGHPFNSVNNVNGVDGDADGDDSGEEVHELNAVPAVAALQKAYVRKVIDTVNEFDNVLFEVSNESHAESVEWQLDMIQYVKSYEATKPKQHPVGMTSTWPNGQNADLYASGADWISPNGQIGDPPPADGRKVVIADTDHLCGICGDRTWVWKAFTRGENPAFMDVYDEQANVLDPHDLSDPDWEDVRRSLGLTRMLAERLDLAAMVPRGDLTSTRYCLAAISEGRAAYVVYAPGQGPFEVDLAGAPGPLEVEWLNPQTGSIVQGDSIEGGRTRTFESPFAGDAVLYLH